MAKDAQVLFGCTKAFKDALGEYAQKNNVSMAIVIIEAVARQINYDLENEDIRDGRKKYANAEARREAQMKRQRTERAEVKKLLEALAKEQRLRDALIIEDSLKARGINPND